MSLHWNCLCHLCNDNNSNDNDPTENDTLDPMRVIKCLWLPLFKYRERKGESKVEKGFVQPQKLSLSVNGSKLMNILVSI